MLLIHTPEEWNTLCTECVDKVIVVQFGATWCGPCKRITPFVEKFAADPQFRNTIFCKIDIDEAESQLWDWAMVPSVPTFRFVKNGNVIGSFSDSNPELLYKNLLKYA